MLEYQQLVRVLFQRSIAVFEIALDIRIKSFSSKDDKLIIINTNQMRSESEKAIELKLQIKKFDLDEFMNF